MTTELRDPALTRADADADVALTDEELLARFRPVFDRIAAGALDREESGRLALVEAGWLRDAGFTAVRVPARFGGGGAGLRQLFVLLVELAAAESNLPHALRVHFSFTEDRWREQDTPRGRDWLRRVAGGVIIGTAVSEPVGAFGSPATTLRGVGHRRLLNGTKYYSTGALYADWLTVLAADADAGGERVTALVRADAAGVQLVDDWAGFGQRASASGTSVFTDVEVEEPSLVLPPPGGVPGRVAFFQLVHLATLAGIVRRATDDVAEFVRRRHRTYPHASASVAREDPLVQQVVGRADAAARATRAITLDAVASLERAVEARLRVNRLPEPERAAADRAATDLAAQAELDSFRAQSVVIDLALETTTRIFEVGGSSALDRKHHLDRHWRNARTLASHNPVIYRERQLGDFVLNGTWPTFGSPEVPTSSETTGER